MSPTGQYNSSITRVRPVFQQLLRKDATGESWLANLLELAQRTQRLMPEVITRPGQILEELAEKRDYNDRILKHYGVEKPLKLEKCFEKSLPPPADFLRWLIQNLSQAMKSGDQRLENLAGDRRDLFDTRKPDAQRAAIDAALEQLNSLGAKRSFRQWWAFEGFTEVDCYLETDELVLLIEGKRTEPLSAATMWYPERNQIIRNLEVAATVGQEKDKKFAVLLIGEDIVDFDLDKELTVGLPHMGDEERLDLGEHYLGCITWKQVCDHTGLDFDSLPDTSKEVADKLLGKS